MITENVAQPASAKLAIAELLENVAPAVWAVACGAEPGSRDLVSREDARKARREFLFRLQQAAAQERAADWGGALWRGLPEDLSLSFDDVLLAAHLKAEVSEVWTAASTWWESAQSSPTSRRRELLLALRAAVERALEGTP